MFNNIFKGEKKKAKENEQKVQQRILEICNGIRMVLRDKKVNTSEMMDVLLTLRSQLDLDVTKIISEQFHKVEGLEDQVKQLSQIPNDRTESKENRSEKDKE